MSTIRNSEELRRGTIEQLEKARVRLQKVELEADEYRMNGYSEIEREKENLINATSISLEQLEKSKNEILYFEKQRAMNQVRQRVFQQAVQGALGTLNSCLNTAAYLQHNINKPDLLSYDDIHPTNHPSTIAGWKYCP